MQETSDGRFRARAGTLTLLSATILLEREVLLEMLAGARAGGMLPPIDPDEWAAEQEAGEIEDEEEDFEEDEDEDFGDEDFEDEEEDLDLGALPPDAVMGLTPTGEVMLAVGLRLKRWLDDCPRGPLVMGSAEASEALLTLIFCWSAKVIQALAAAPLSLAELSEMSELLDLETLEEHVAALARTGQVEARLAPDGTTRYAVTEWLREGITPIAVATQHECHRPTDDVLPPDWLDVEAAFQLALPLVSLPAELSGTCRLGVEFADGGPPAVAGAMALVERGRIASCTGLLDEQADAWASGGAAEWLDTVVDPAAMRLESGGDRRLAKTLVEGLHERLFAIPAR